MRGLRRLTIVAGVLFLIAAFQPYVGTLFASHQTLFYRSNARGGFQPVGIDFNFRLSEPTQENVARMLVTRPLSGNPRQLQQRDADATGFRLRITLPDRSSNNPFIDSVAAIPDALGKATTEAGFTPNDILVSQGLKVYKISGAEAGLPLSSPPPVFVQPDDSNFVGSTCASGNSDLIFDRWGTSDGTVGQFKGKVILTCQGSSGLEIWLIAPTSPGASTGTATYLTTLATTTVTGAYSGRSDITSPNFSGCGGCLAAVTDNTLNVTLINGSGGTLPVPVTDIWSTSAGKRQVLTVPPRVYAFGTSGGCLFGTVPSANSILQFPCSPPSPTPTTPNVVFSNTDNGDLLIFTPSATVVRVKNTDGSASRVDTSTGTYEDLAFSPRRQVEIIVQQPAVPNPNQGVQGNILFYILSIVNPTTGQVLFDPQNDVNISSILFGRTGSEPSVNGNCNAGVGTDVNKDGVPDLKCFADPAIAQCGGLVLCIVTGFTENPSGFEGD